MKIGNGKLPDLNLLLALEALLEHSNVTRAAEAVGLTQSAMSHKLRRLREEFGDPLLVNGRGRLVPTPRAQELLGPLRHALREVRGVWADPKPFDPATSEREFVVVSSDFAEFSILPLVLEHCSKYAPYVRCFMRTPWPGLLQALEDGSVDIIMGPQLPPSAGLVQRKVAEDSVCCLVREDHPVVGDTIDMDTYLRVHHLVRSDNKGSDVDDMLAARGLERRVTMTIPHFVGAPFIVARSDLILTTSAALGRVAAKILPVRMLEPPFETDPYGVYMTWHERFTRDPGQRWLRELAAETTAAVV